MESERTVLIITNHYPGKKSGGSLASLAIINSFGTLFKNCSLIYPSDGSEDCSSLEHNINLVPCYDKRPRWLKGLQVYGGKLHRFADLAMQTILAKDPDIVVFDTSLVSSRILNEVVGRQIMTITVHHNVESDYVRDNSPSLIYRFPYIYFLKKAERQSLAMSCLNLTLTKNDLADFIGRFGQKNVSLIRCCGAFEYRPSGENRLSVREKNPETGKIKFIMTGSLEFKQSDRSIKKFIRELWPLLKDLAPGAELTVMGSKPSGGLSRICRKTQGIKLVSNPEDINELIKGYNIYLCPVDTGSGVKFRIADGLREGLPAVVHKKSLAGYESLAEKGFVLVYDSKESFLENIREVLRIKYDHDRIAREYWETFSFESGVSRLKSILAEIGLWRNGY